MKILEITHRFPPSIGGSQKHVLAISQALTALGHEVTVLTSMSLAQDDVRGLGARGLIFKNSYPKLPTEETVNGIKVYRFKSAWQFFTWLQTPDLRLWIDQHLDEYDVVHTHGYTFMEPWYALGKTRIRRVHTAHDLTQPHANPIFRLGMWKYNIFWGKRLLAAQDALIALTEENRTDYRVLGVPDNKIDLIPNGVDYERFQSDPTHKPEGLEILFVGRLVEYKGAQHILNAMPEILKHHHDAHLTIVGEDQGYGQKLIALARKLDIEKSISFVGQVKDRELTTYYRKAHFFVLPSISEGFGLVALEAIAAGCYPILADTKALKYLLQEIGGGRINAQSCVTMRSDIARIIIGLSGETRIKEVHRMQTIVQRRYSWTGIAQELLKSFIN